MANDRRPILIAHIVAHREKDCLILEPKSRHLTLPNAEQATSLDVMMHGVWGSERCSKPHTSLNNEFHMQAAQCVNDVVVSESSTAHETKYSTIYFLLSSLVFRLIHYSATKWKTFGLQFVLENFKWFLIYIELTRSEEFLLPPANDTHTRKMENNVSLFYFWRNYNIYSTRKEIVSTSKVEFCFVWNLPFDSTLLDDSEFFTKHSTIVSHDSSWVISI